MCLRLQLCMVLAFLALLQSKKVMSFVRHRSPITAVATTAQVGDPE